MQINHSEYQAKLKTLPIESLYFIIRDCKEALETMPGSPKAGYYQDEIHYCAMEIRRRTA